MARRTAPAPPGPGDDDLAALYQVPLADFIDARNALAARLRKAGDTAASARVKALPKPGAPAWALNQVYWHARGDYDRMIAAGDRLRSLQQQMLGGRAVDPRGSMQERQAAVRQVVERAARFLADSGQPATDATRQRLGVTADALATWGSQPQGYTPGRLDHDIDPPGFAALASLGTPSLRLVKSGRDATTDAATPPPEPRAAPPAGKPPPRAPTPAQTAAARRAAAREAQEAARARDAERRRLAHALQDAEREVRSLAAARERTAAALSRAAADTESIAQELAALEQQLARVRARADRAERARSEADAAAAEAGRAHEAAEAAAADVRRALDDFDRSGP
jgi:hypothetical protein